MPSRALSLSPDHLRFVDDQVASGAYPDAAAVIEEALERLANAQDDAAREARFDRLLQEGLDDLDAGRYETVTDTKAWLDGLAREVKAEPR